MHLPRVAALTSLAAAGVSTVLASTGTPVWLSALPGVLTALTASGLRVAEAVRQHDQFRHDHRRQLWRDRERHKLERFAVHAAESHPNPDKRVDKLLELLRLHDAAASDLDDDKIHPTQRKRKRNKETGSLPRA